jgi:hypothetical protein
MLYERIKIDYYVMLLDYLIFRLFYNLFFFIRYSHSYGYNSIYYLLIL